jgi:hypothetical protein
MQQAGWEPRNSRILSPPDCVWSFPFQPNHLRVSPGSSGTPQALLFQRVTSDSSTCLCQLPAPDNATSLFRPTSTKLIFKEPPIGFSSDRYFIDSNWRARGGLSWNNRRDWKWVGKLANANIYSPDSKSAKSPGLKIWMPSYCFNTSKSLSPVTMHSA